MGGIAGGTHFPAHSPLFANPLTSPKGSTPTIAGRGFFHRIDKILTTRTAMLFEK